MSLNFSHLLPPTFKEKVKEWIIEDVPSFDFGAAVVGDSEEEAHLYAKSNLSKLLKLKLSSSLRSSFC
jgi:nicotinate-nucleotide pyrophosphorylase (carboxylating)